jgi:acyl carrier protein
MALDMNWTQSHTTSQVIMENTKTSIEAILVQYVRENCLPRNDGMNLKYDTNLFDAGIVDSAGLISFLCYIEEEFDMSIPDEDLLPENFDSISRIADYIITHQQVSYERS